MGRRGRIGVGERENGPHPQSGDGAAARLTPARIAYVGEPGLVGALTVATLEDAGYEVDRLNPAMPAAATWSGDRHDACVVELASTSGAERPVLLSFAKRAADVVIVIGADGRAAWAADDDCLVVRRPCSPRFLTSLVGLALRGGIAA